jgi:phosphoglycolate phosphatase-like HAD superfamily hydrolase
MRRYEHVIFDFDGVLCDSLTMAIAEFNDIRDRSFPAVPRVSGRDDMVKVYGGSLRTSLSEWLDPTEHRRFFDLHSAAMAALTDELAPFEGVEEMLAALPANSASIVTSAYSAAVISVLGTDGKLPHSIYAVIGRETGQTKTEKLQDLTRRLEISPADCLYVGDLESDAIYCRAVPIDILAVTYGYHPRWHLEKTDAVGLVDSVAELRSSIGRSLNTSPRNLARR